MNLVDTHAHLDFESQGQTVEDRLIRAKENKVSKIICVGTSVDASKKCAAIAKKYSADELRIFATVGIHAQDDKDDVLKYGSIEKCVDELRKISNVRDSIDPSGLQNDKVGAQNDPPSLFELRRASSKVVIGVGEAGFDFREGTGDEEKKFQRELFGAQVGLAVELRLPLVVHCRNAFDETFDLLSKYLNYSSSRGREVSLKTTNNSNSNGKFSPANAGSNNNIRGVFHSWTGSWIDAQRALAMGFYISFSGIVTFKNALSVQEVALKMPLDFMLLETDSPFLAPEPHRGSPNEPKNVRIVAEFIAKLRNLPLDQLADITSENAEKLFGI